MNSESTLSTKIFLVIRYVLCLNILIINLGCKKKSKELTIVTVDLYNPVTNEPYSNVEFSFSLNEKIDKYGLPYETEVEKIWRGKTNANGQLHYAFKALKNDKYFYTLSYPDLPLGDFFTEGVYYPYEPFEDNYYRIEKDQINSKKFGFVKVISYIIHFKNLNCSNANDHVKYRYKSPYFMNWTGWNSTDIDNDGFGCVDFRLDKRLTKQGKYTFELEVTRNGNSNTLSFTFDLLGQNSTDTLQLFY